MIIGIGITTYFRPECMELFLKQFENNPPKSQYRMHVAIDVPSVARAKNECLKNLQDCDAIFLFDDDCFPIKPHWDIPFLESGSGHLLYMNKTYQAHFTFDKITQYADCSGCFMFLSKDVFSHIGYFNNAYQRYGSEHVGYSDRARRYLKKRHFECLNQTPEFIYSLDLQGTAGWPNVHHTSFASEKFISRDEMKNNLQHNKAVLEQELQTDKLYYDYE